MWRWGGEVGCGGMGVSEGDRWEWGWMYGCRGGGWFVSENGGGGCKSVWNVSVCVNKRKKPVRHERLAL